MTVLLYFSWFSTRSTDGYASKNWRGSLTLLSLIFYSLYVYQNSHTLKLCAWISLSMGFIVLNIIVIIILTQICTLQIWERCECLQTTINNLKIWTNVTNEWFWLGEKLQELDPVTLHNQALMNMEADPTQVQYISD